MSVRRAELADARAIAEVHVRTWQAAYRHAFPAEVLDSLSVDDREDLARRLLERWAEVVWVAEADGRIVGFASVGPSRTEEGSGELYAIYVLPEAWGTGAASGLMAEAKDWFAKEGYPTADALGARRQPARAPLLRARGLAGRGMSGSTPLRGVEVEESALPAGAGRRIGPLD